MKIGELSTLSGVPIDTIRYYERQGLLPLPQRTRSNYRAYPPGATRQLVFIRRAQDLGFTLKEIADLLVLSQDHQADAGAVRQSVQEKLEILNHRIQSMLEMKKSLEQLVKACSGLGPRSSCPILEALAGDAQTH